MNWLFGNPEESKDNRSDAYKKKRQQKYKKIDFTPKGQESRSLQEENKALKEQLKKMQKGDE